MDISTSSMGEADIQLSLASGSSEARTGPGNAEIQREVSGDDNSARTGSINRQNVDNGARETTTSLEMIDEDAAPIHLYDCEEDTMPSERKDLIRESMQSIRESLQSIRESELSIPSESAALSYDDSLNSAKSRMRKTTSWNGREMVTDDTDTNMTVDETDAQPQPLRRPQSLRSVLPISVSRSRPTTANLQPMSPYVRESDDIITANVRLSIPYINQRDEICVLEATAVPDDDIPSATVVRPEKYSLTIAGYKCQLRFLVLGTLLLLAVVIALTTALSRKSVIEPESFQPAPVYSSTPTTSMIPTSAPSTEPSITPTSTLQANLLDIIYDFSGGNISKSFEDVQSKHREALDWLVNDQLERQSDGHLSLTNAEIVERFVLALIYLETYGEDWSNSFEFMTKEHHCRWRGSLRRTFRKGVTKCTTDGSTRRIMNLTLWNNNLQGSLPTELGLLKELTALHAGFNDIEGIIPGSLANITHLELNNNDLTGQLDLLAGMTNLQIVDLSSNELSGNLMDASSLTKMESFKINNNQLTGVVPESFKQLSSLETLHIEDNHLSGNINFLCHDLPSDYLLDCYGTEPEVACNCCVGCTIKNEEECTLESERIILLDVHSGPASSNFEWGLYRNDAIIAAGGEYYHEEMLSIQLCLTFPGHYVIFTSSNMNQVTDVVRAGVTYTIGEHSSFVETNSLSHINLTDEGLVKHKPTPMPTPSRVPTQMPGPAVNFVDHTPTTFSPTYSPTTNYPTYSPNNLPKPTRPPMMLKPGVPTLPPITLTPTDGVHAFVPGSTGSCGDFVAKKECMKSSDVECGWDNDNRICVAIEPEPLPESIGPSGGRDPEVVSHSCDNGPKFALSLTTDAFGIDTTWELFDKNTNAVVVSNSSFPSNQTLQFTECLDPRGCYEFVIQDDWDDGICCEEGNGSYNVSINDRLIASGGEFGSSESVFLGGNCGVDATDKITCEEGNSLLNMTIFVDQFSAGATWEVFDMSTGQVYATNEHALALNTMEYTSSVKCIPEQECYQLSVYDKEMKFEGFMHWILEYNNDAIISEYGDPGQPESTTTFGPHCVW